MAFCIPKYLELFYDVLFFFCMGVICLLAVARLEVKNGRAIQTRTGDLYDVNVAL
jgi:hypothetical protein